MADLLATSLIYLETFPKGCNRRKKLIISL
jgi:hypothetical protein